MDEGNYSHPWIHFPLSLSLLSTLQYLSFWKMNCVLNIISKLLGAFYYFFFKERSGVVESMDESLEEGSVAAETWGHTWRGLAPCWTLVCKRGDPPTALLYITLPANSCLRPPQLQLSKVFYMPKAQFCHRRAVFFFLLNSALAVTVLLHSSWVFSPSLFPPGCSMASSW